MKRVKRVLALLAALALVLAMAVPAFAASITIDWWRRMGQQLDCSI